MLTLLCALTKDFIIGNDQNLPWPSEKGDLKIFKLLTWNHKIIMGRKTFASLNYSPLKGRDNYVLTTQKQLHDKYHAANLKFVFDYNDLVTQYQNSQENVFVIGGAEVYQLFYEYVTYAYLCFMNEQYQGNIKLTCWDQADWTLQTKTKFLNFSYYIYKKKEL